jgi:hypothetical protein
LWVAIPLNARQEGLVNGFVVVGQIRPPGSKREGRRRVAFRMPAQSLYSADISIAASGRWL